MSSRIKNIKARPHSRINSLRGREILNSRGEPTVEVELATDAGIFLASAPSGASKGKYEVKELRDGGKRYGGRGVLKAVKNINKKIAPKLKNREVKDQERIDELLIELDGTKNKYRLGANAILPVSMAVCRAGAETRNIPLYEYISQLFGQKVSRTNFPSPCFNLINGGVHAGSDLELQEFMINPQVPDYKKSLQAAAEIYYALKKILIKKFGKKSINVGDEGGFAPPINKTKTALNLLMTAIKSAGYGNKVRIALDCAASQFAAGTRDNLFYMFEGRRLGKSVLLNFYQDLIKHYPIFSIEDPFSENDFTGFKEIYGKLGKRVLFIGDDLLATNPERMKKAFEEKLCSGLLLKINQIGTITEALRAAKLARSFSWKIMVSHRSGETNDDFISDFAVGISADFIKAGSPARGERVAKYNRLLRIEQEIS